MPDDTPTPRHPDTPLLLLGGTFDPPHIAHLVLAECARHQLGAERVVFLPAGDPWRKTTRVPGPQSLALSPPAVTPAHHRLAMVRLAVADNPHFAVDDREVRREGPTYTVDTLEELHAEGHTNLVLILGSDALNDLPNWKSPDRIRELAQLAIALKHGARLGSKHQALSTIEMPDLRISSTAIRARVAAGLPIRYLVPATVEAHIAAHRLYR